MRYMPQGEIDEITNHIDTTINIMVKAYTPRQLARLDGIDVRTVKRSGRYIPVRIDARDNKYRYLRGLNTVPYCIRWIRVDEIKSIFSKRNKGKKILVEELK